MDQRIESPCAYDHTDDADLLDLARSPEGDFAPEAWAALQREIARRGLFPDAAAGAPMPKFGRFGGWLTFFSAYELLMALGMVLSAQAHLAAVTDLLFNAYAFAIVAGVGLIVYRKTIAPSFWKTMLVIQFLFVGSLLLRGLAGLYLLLPFIWPIVWFQYWSKSARVRATFCP